MQIISKKQEQNILSNNYKFCIKQWLSFTNLIFVINNNKMSLTLLNQINLKINNIIHLDITNVIDYKLNFMLLTELKSFNRSQIFYSNIVFYNNILQKIINLYKYDKNIFFLYNSLKIIIFSCIYICTNKIKNYSFKYIHNIKIMMKYTKYKICIYI